MSDAYLNVGGFVDDVVLPLGSAAPLVLAAVAERMPQATTALHLCRALRLGPGTVYPVLAALEHREFVRGRWGRPPRWDLMPQRAFEITATGRCWLTERRTRHFIRGLWAGPRVIPRWAR
jgi:DNA-binding PadR family transcriptional regulator